MFEDVSAIQQNRSGIRIIDCRKPKSVLVRFRKSNWRQYAVITAFYKTYGCEQQWK